MPAHVLQGQTIPLLKTVYGFWRLALKLLKYYAVSRNNVWEITELL
jgi:hypothetical protein